jgi:hypothetical protein
MNPIIIFNDISINIKIIDDKKSHYQLNIPNNEANKKLIENTIFKFVKCGSVIIMQYDIHVFQLSKMECKYSDYIEMKVQMEYIKEQLKNTEKEVILLKQELSKNEKELVNFKNELLQQMKNEMVQLKNELFDTNNLLQKQIEKVNDKSIEVDKLKEYVNICNYYSPIVFEYRGRMQTYYADEHYVWWTNTLTSEQVSKLGRKLLTRHNGCTPPHNSFGFTMHIPVGKIVILFKESIEIYLSGIHYGIYPSHSLWFGKELDKEEVIISLKNIGYNCDNIIYF